MFDQRSKPTKANQNKNHCDHVRPTVNGSPETRGVYHESLKKKTHPFRAFREASGHASPLRRTEGGV